MLLLTVMLATGAGCAASNPPRTPRVGQVVMQSKPTDHADAAIAHGGARSAGPLADTTSRRMGPDSPSVASLDGAPIDRQEFLGLLIRSRGAALLEQIIVLRMAERIAAEQGLDVTPADIEAEHERGLRRLTDPLSAITGRAFDRLAAEEVLARLLDDRQISREEYQLAVRRNAFLRRLALEELHLGESDLREEYDRVFGERVEVRHIQLSSPAEVERVSEALRSGEDFGDLARRYSLNSAGTMNHGLLQPFSRRDEAVPAALREAAFAANPGELTAPVRVGSWYHLLRVERRLPAEAPNWESVRLELERRLQDRMVEPKLAQLHERLFHEARVRIEDPVLREAYEKKYGRIGR